MIYWSSYICILESLISSGKFSAIFSSHIVSTPSEYLFYMTFPIEDILEPFTLCSVFYSPFCISLFWSPCVLLILIYNCTLFYHALLIALYRYWRFYKLKVCGNPTSSKYTGTVFLAAFAHFMFLSHFDNFLNISNYYFNYCSIYYGDLWSLH